VHSFDYDPQSVACAEELKRRYLLDDRDWVSSYNALPKTLRWLVLIPALARLWGKNTVRDILRGKPFEAWRNYSTAERGMGAWRDVVDWVGGYPFEVAKPEEVFDFYRSRGFFLQRLKTCAGGLGCNEYVLMKSDK